MEPRDEPERVGWKGPVERLTGDEPSQMRERTAGTLERPKIARIVRGAVVVLDRPQVETREGE